MKEALEKAAADTQFQFFLARLFGQFIRRTNDRDMTEVQGYLWRGQLFIVKLIDLTRPSPSSDSQHRSLPDF